MTTATDWARWRDDARARHRRERQAATARALNVAFAVHFACGAITALTAVWAWTVLR